MSWVWQESTVYTLSRLRRISKLSQSKREINSGWSAIDQLWQPGLNSDTATHKIYKPKTIRWIDQTIKIQIWFLAFVNRVEQKQPSFNFQRKLINWSISCLMRSKNRMILHQYSANNLCSQQYEHFLACCMKVWTLLSLLYESVHLYRRWVNMKLWCSVSRGNPWIH